MGGLSFLLLTSLFGQTLIFLFCGSPDAPLMSLSHLGALLLYC